MVFCFVVVFVACLDSLIGGRFPFEVFVVVCQLCHARDFYRVFWFGVVRILACLLRCRVL